MYVVTGITGQVGSAVARHLLAAHQTVRAVVRDRGKAAPWAKLGCDIAVANYSDAASLGAAFEGTEGVFAMLPPIFDPAPGFPEAETFIEALGTALAQAKPARVVALSTIGADASQPNLLNVLGRMENELGSLPMPITFLRAAWFIENAAWDIAAAKRGLIQSYLQPLDRAVPMISVDDVGRTAAGLLQERWQGRRVVELEAAQRVSPNMLAAAFANALGHSVRVEAVPRGQWESDFRAQGMKNPGPRMQMIDGFNAGWLDFQNRGANARRGVIGVDHAIATLLHREPI
jgi:uncharacterized protein YbjT (DUF2867 family)